MLIQVKDSSDRMINVDLVGDALVRYNVINDAMKIHAPLLGFDASSAMRITGRSSANDAQEALHFLVSQLAYTEAKALEKKRTPMQYEQLVPLDYSAGEHVDSIRYEIVDGSGEAEDISPSGDDVPEVDVSYADKTMSVPYAGIGYSFTDEELLRTAFLRRPISTAKLDRAVDAYRRKLNSVALNGNTKKNLTGLYNTAGVTTANRPSGATWAASIAAGTPEKVLQDVNFGIKTVWAATKFTEMPTTLLVPPLAYGELLNPRSSGSDMSLLAWIQKNNLAVQNGQPFEILPGFGLDTAGTGGSINRAIFYCKKSECCVMHIPMALRFKAPQNRGLKVIVPGSFKYSGFHLRITETMYYMETV
jgi:hypothetical protein